MKGKKPFALRVNPETMKVLEKWAADEFRSVNGHLEWIISKALKEAGRHPGMTTRGNSKSQAPNNK